MQMGSSKNLLTTTPLGSVQADVLPAGAGATAGAAQAAERSFKSCCTEKREDEAGEIHGPGAGSPLRKQLDRTRPIIRRASQEA